MHKSLNEVNWKVIQMATAFNCDKGEYLPTTTVVDGDIPFVTAKAENNGIGRFIANKTLFKGNCITIEKVRLSAYYQPASFYCSHDVSVISNAQIDEDNALFIATMIMRNGSKYSYGRQAQLNVVKRESFLLPTSDSIGPDYDFMTAYVREKRASMLAKS